jgi:hypothetical protein
MTLTRREFIKGVGIAAASLVLLQCNALTPHDDSSPRGKLRRTWLQLGWLAEQSTDAERGQQALEDLAAQHRAALDELVAAEELTPEVADELQTAYEAAAYHVFRSHAPITCYEPVLVDYAPVSSEQLTAQADLLAEMASQAGLDPTTVSQAQASIERDIAFLGLTSDERQALYDPLIQAANQGATIPPFDQVDLEITPEAREAARFLVGLLLEE